MFPDRTKRTHSSMEFAMALFRISRAPGRVLFLAVLLAAASLPAGAAVKILACEPEWGALAQEIGGDLVDVGSATSAMQDPHQVQAKPSLISRARNADMVA